jgi:hypothetical protein
MDAAIISALSGLAGAAIGGSTSAFSSVLGERTKDRRKAAEDAFNRRASLYTEFIKEAANHFAEAVTSEAGDPKQLVALYALIARMRLGSPHEVVAAAETVMVKLQEEYAAPTLSLTQIDIFTKGGKTDPLLEFSEVGREDLERAIAGLLK